MEGGENMVRFIAICVLVVATVFVGIPLTSTVAPAYAVGGGGE